MDSQSISRKLLVSVVEHPKFQCGLELKGCRELVVSTVCSLW